MMVMAMLIKMDKTHTSLADLSWSPRIALACRNRSSQSKTIGIDLKINNTINQQEFLASGNWDIYASAFVTAPTGDPEYFFTTHCLQNSAKIVVNIITIN